MAATHAEATDSHLRDSSSSEGGSTEGQGYAQVPAGETSAPAGSCRALISSRVALQAGNARGRCGICAARGERGSLGRVPGGSFAEATHDGLTLPLEVVVEGTLMRVERDAVLHLPARREVQDGLAVERRVLCPPQQHALHGHGARRGRLCARLHPDPRDKLGDGCEPNNTRFTAAT